MSVAALLLADGRFPAGGHAHSGGMEPAVKAGLVVDLGSLKQFLLGKLHTSGLIGAAIAAAACGGAHDFGQLDREAGARTPSPALRATSRRQGRQLLRAAIALWPGQILDDLSSATMAGPHLPVATGAACAAAGLDSLEAARSSLYAAITSPAGAAVKLLGLDPLAVHALLAALAPAMDTVAAEAAMSAHAPLSELPFTGSLLCDLLAEQHAQQTARLFAS